MESGLFEIPTREAKYEANTLGAIDAAVPGETGVIKRTDENLIRQLTRELDKQLLVVLSCRTADEFTKSRREVWDKYFRARRALNDTLNLLVPKSVIRMVSLAAAERVSEELTRYRNSLFRDEVAQQFEFTSWLVNRIQCVAHDIEKAGSPSDKDADIRLSDDFALFTAWGQFHYDCVLASMQFERPIPEKVQGSIRDGLRAWVNASAIIEEALSLRIADSQEGTVEVHDQPWDDEDQELLDSSMRDLDAESSATL